MKNTAKSHKALAIAGLEELLGRINQLEPGIHKRLLFAHAQGIAEEVAQIQELVRPRKGTAKKASGGVVAVMDGSL